MKHPLWSSHLELKFVSLYSPSEWRETDDDGNRYWNTEFGFTIDFSGLDEDPVPNLDIEGCVAIDFAGFVIIPENLFPKPGTAEEAADLLSLYVKLDNSFSCTDENWRYVFNRR